MGKICQHFVFKVIQDKIGEKFGFLSQNFGFHVKFCFKNGFSGKMCQNLVSKVKKDKTGEKFWLLSQNFGFFGQNLSKFGFVESKRIKLLKYFVLRVNICANFGFLSQNFGFHVKFCETNCQNFVF